MANDPKNDPKNEKRKSKNKGISEISEPDEFISKVDKVFEALRPHAKAFITVIAAVFLGLVAWTVWDWRAEVKREAATDAYARASALVSAKIVAEGEEPPEARAAGVELPVTFPNREARGAASTKLLRGVASEFSSVGVGALAELKLGNVAYEVGDYSKAAGHYRNVAAAKLPVLLRVTAQENLGMALEGEALALEDSAQRQAGLQKALATFQAMQASGGGVREDFALYHQGRIQSLLGNSEDALNLYNKLLADFADSELVPTVKSRLAGLGSK